jgi:hypothetical protein
MNELELKRARADQVKMDRERIRWALYAVSQLSDADVHAFVDQLRNNSLTGHKRVRLAVDAVSQLSDTTLHAFVNGLRDKQRNRLQRILNYSRHTNNTNNVRQINRVNFGPGYPMGAVPTNSEKRERHIRFGAKPMRNILPRIRKYAQLSNIAYWDHRNNGRVNFNPGYPRGAVVPSKRQRATKFINGERVGGRVGVKKNKSKRIPKIRTKTSADASATSSVAAKKHAAKQARAARIAGARAARIAGAGHAALG